MESAVGAHLLSMSDELDYEVYYWRVPSRNKDDNDKEEILVFANILFVIVLMFGNILLSFFFCNQLSQSHEVRYPKAGDFLVDNTEVGHRNRIPLWLFGLLY